jgi:Bacteriocin-protection, YdeI or OmpD-Associated/Domain of unknown function (DUF1905)
MQYTIEKFGKGWPFHVVLDPETVDMLLVDGNKRAVATVVNTNERFHCGVTFRKTLGHYVFVNADICKKMGLKEGDKIDLTFVIDESKYQFEMPEELAEVFAQDPEADKIFHELTAGKQRGLIYLISQVKSSDKKIERALKVAEKLKMGISVPQLILK